MNEGEALGLTIGSLFSGIGLLELGLEWAGVGCTVWQVECDPFPRSILVKHWPDADRSVTDVHRAGAATLAPVDLICGGFPCQDISVAGKGEGLAGARSGLWFEYERVIRELRPRYVVIENVSALLARGMVRVLGDLAQLGYDAEWTTLRASDVGAPHRRERIFIVAHAPLERRERDARGGWQARRGSQHVGDAEVADPDGGRREGVRLEESSGKCGARGRELDRRGDSRRLDDSDGMAHADEFTSHEPIEFARRQEASRAGLDGEPSRSGLVLADATRGGLGELGRASRRAGHAHVGSPPVANAASTRREGAISQSSERRTRPELGGDDVADTECGALRTSADGHGRRRGAAQPRDAREEDGRRAQRGLGRGVDGRAARVDRWPSGPGEEQNEWEPPRAIPSKTDPHRRKRLKALGNAVVPQCAYEVGLHVRRLIESMETP